MALNGRAPWPGHFITFYFIFKVSLEFAMDSTVRWSKILLELEGRRQRRWRRRRRGRQAVISSQKQKDLISYPLRNLEQNTSCSLLFLSLSLSLFRLFFLNIIQLRSSVLSCSWLSCFQQQIKSIDELINSKSINVKCWFNLLNVTMR